MKKSQWLLPRQVKLPRQKGAGPCSCGRILDILAGTKLQEQMAAQNDWHWSPCESLANVTPNQRGIWVLIGRISKAQFGAAGDSAAKQKDW